ncbi:hypothetical protein A2631_04775 [Candidatus Daviesbacteria bacterium RIFCSPHIGHO2_01_FULL_44_29]|uniref:Undecaprenyl-phosphate alpha-N-acetylglucosaminyl 1-phosphate transferase n=1 Tax=Candidatus Daviesbacteria bacterium RIFCSPHIGHO2_02_FULL_43_12 TaxID=1797776 RepID=A0A1F5KGV8_9BACT|nr:MAG: hypothetical protein A2631_04775 [Candidatus Daviesbacteria bacterium RIFCSPHIGHO2_01_FULL_44_29]OGE40035.1 MAG: hypothetical protein A3D25_04505 [Candidatus Daviesbacteria bacterium RIFCSPHIGHO2_02_FULL_43_12]OGE41483.1 MAG: hypothetical protein A3E86_05305 [Candidatus Daviesbacteria bacterium RIFCSPHIGHO2_12_FULL_47_45]OGE70284.1 MAG: hypothetical protein A3B55_01065 [Candidatus Daviesbacteria bacterium RIFCSPLOWO2_01_FULL_43_15]
MDILFVFALACLLTAAFVPVTIKIAERFGLIDNPSIRPHPAHVHTKITPRAGGLAIYVGIVVTSLLLLPLTKYLVGIVIGSTILLILGLIDDRVRTFNPYLRLCLLFLAAGAAVISGIGITYVNNPLIGFLQLGPPFNEQILRLDQIIIPINIFGSHNIVLFADIFAFLWIVTLTQVINWSKGVDGQMPSITLTSAVILGLLSLKLFLAGDPNQLNVGKLAFIVAGSSLGFLFFNWYPAKIQPGFSASTILAFLLAILSILSGAKLATALLVMAIPIIDFLYTFFRRIMQGRSPVWGDRGHLHHKLLALGWSPQRISLFYMATSFILGGISLFANAEGKFFALLSVTIVVLLFIVWINSFGDLSKRPGLDNGSKT